MKNKDGSNWDRLKRKWGDLLAALLTPKSLLLLGATASLFIAAHLVFSLHENISITLRVLGGLSAVYAGITISKELRDLSGEDRFAEKGKLFAPTLKRLSELSTNKGVSKAELNRHIETASLTAESTAEPKRKKRKKR